MTFLNRSFKWLYAKYGEQLRFEQLPGVYYISRQDIKEYAERKTHFRDVLRLVRNTKSGWSGILVPIKSKSRLEEITLKWASQRYQEI